MPPHYGPPGAVPYAPPQQHYPGYWPATPPKPPLGSRLLAVLRRINPKVTAISALGVGVLALLAALAGAWALIDSITILRDKISANVYLTARGALTTPVTLIAALFLILGGFRLYNRPLNGLIAIVIGAALSAAAAIAFIALTFDGRGAAALTIPGFILAITSGIPLLLSVIHLVLARFNRRNPAEPQGTRA
jgi:hypothetical protein